MPRWRGRMPTAREYVRLALVRLPTLVKRVAAKLHFGRARLPRNGAWA